jgi:hypothetical protein
MKLLIRIFIVVVCLALLATVALHAVVRRQGKTLLIQKLTQVFQREVLVGSVETRFPFDIIINNLQVKDRFKIGRVFAGGGLIDILRRSFVLSVLRLDGVEVNIERGQLNDTAGAGPGVSAAKGAPEKKEIVIFLPQLVLKRFIINNGTLYFSDKNAGENGIALTIKDLHVLVDNLAFPVKRSFVTSFELSGNIPWQVGREQGTVAIEGWVDPFKKNAEATAKLEKIDGVYLHPYYAQWVDLEKTRIDKATLNVSSTLHALSNNATVDCHLELTDIVFKPRSLTEETGKAEQIAHTVLSIFKALNDGKVILDFSFKTKLDSPVFNFAEIKTAVEDKLSQGTTRMKFEGVGQVPGWLLEGMVNGVADVSKAAVSGALGIGQTLGKILTDPFKKDKGEK